MGGFQKAPRGRLTEPGMLALAWSGGAQTLTSAGAVAGLAIISFSFSALTTIGLPLAMKRWAASAMAADSSAIGAWAQAAGTTTASTTGNSLNR